MATLKKLWNRDYRFYVFDFEVCDLFGDLIEADDFNTVETAIICAHDLGEKLDIRIDHYSHIVYVDLPC